MFKHNQNAKKSTIRFLMICTYTGDLKTLKIHENSLFL